MPTQPAIIVSSLDYERLAAWMERLPAQDKATLTALEAELERAEVVEPESIPAGIITMNSTARVRIEQSGEEKLLTLVYPNQADGTAGHVSILAPIGAALLGLAEGQSIDWPTLAGQTRLTVLEVIYQPEAAGELHR
ncbi:nucleoside diphosphate kinase regulator [Aquitalea aquatica]|uniref:Nucleoside diphosphate kinase regulator n=1 Tax=Aquitalea aquatica TaxID=3044273 RepID=A0A838YEM9_9NEIS|nr:nucleoside diphosphate kinase regulator [Aquitalea magnusonii]MBA4709515.1 nucleoside diphosphate kinase regulator [Aquitalea magnusonii]